MSLNELAERVAALERELSEEVAVESPFFTHRNWFLPPAHASPPPAADPNVIALPSAFTCCASNCVRSTG